MAASQARKRETVDYVVELSKHFLYRVRDEVWFVFLLNCRDDHLLFLQMCSNTAALSNMNPTTQVKINRYKHFSGTNEIRRPRAETNKHPVINNLCSF